MRTLERYGSGWWWAYSTWLEGAKGLDRGREPEISDLFDRREWRDMQGGLAAWSAPRRRPQALRFVPLAAEGAPETVGEAALPEGWLAPVAGVLDALRRRAQDADTSDAELLDMLRRVVDGLPDLLDTMDVDALADVLEAGMGGAALAGARERIDRARAARVPLAIDEIAGVTAAPLYEAVRKLGLRTPVAAKLTSAQWERVPLELRERAMFSARVESIRFLAEVREQLRRALAQELQDVGGGKTARMDRDAFIRRLRTVAEEEGLETGPRGTVRDIRSVKRLGLIYDTQVGQAQEFARWKMDHDPDVLDAFPAQRFVRIEDRQVPRTTWAARWASSGAAVNWAGARRSPMVALKTSPIWTKLSRFGTPWPPFDWGSGMGVEDVDREEAERLGLVERGRPVPDFKDGSGAAGFNQQLEASVRDWRPDQVATLKSAFGDQVQERDGRVRWVGDLIAELTDRVQSAGLDRPFDAQAFRGRTIGFGVATQRTAARAARIGVDLAGARMNLRPENVYHILKGHGAGREVRGDQRDVRVLDLEVLPEVWRNPDRVERGRGDRSIILYKRIMGEMRVVEWDQYRQGMYSPRSLVVKVEP